MICKGKSQLLNSNMIQQKTLDDTKLQNQNYILLQTSLDPLLLYLFNANILSWEEKASIGSISEER